MSPLQPITSHRRRSREEVANDYVAELREEYALGYITFDQFERAIEDVLGSRPMPIKPAMPTRRER